MVHQSSLLLTLVSFFGAGFLLAFTPCVFPMIPILSSLLVGEQTNGTKRAFQLALTFVLSMALTYAIAGLFAGFLGSTLQTWLQQPWIIVSFSVIFVLMAVSMFGFYDLSMPRFLQQYIHRLSNKQQRGRLLGVAIIGCLSTLIASPCVTAPLISILVYIGQTGDALFGAVALFTLALGMGTPLLIFAMGQVVFLPKSGKWMNKVKQLFGVMMLGLAIWMLSRVMPGTITLFLWGALFIISSIALGGLEFAPDRKLPPTWQGVTILALVYGCVLVVGAASGHDQFLYPLASQASVGHLPPEALFTPVKQWPDLEQKRVAAKQAKKPVVLEFYAAWCADCRQIDKEVFADPLIQEHLKSFMLLRVDITRPDKAVKQLMAKFRVLGTPTIIFYDRNGQQLNTPPFSNGVSKEVFDDILLKLMN